MKLEHKLAGQLLENHPQEAAAVLDLLLNREAVAVIKECSAKVAATVLCQMASSAASSIIGVLSVTEASAIIAELPPTSASLILRRLDVQTRDSIVNELPADLSRSIQLLLRHKQHTAGALMDPNALALPSDLTVRQALKIVRQYPQRVSGFLFVVDREQILIGSIGLRELIISSPDTTLSKAAKSPVGRIGVDAEKRSIIANPGWRFAQCLPVVDKTGCFVGAIEFETMRTFELELQGNEAEPSMSTADALGSLFWTGMVGLLGAVFPASNEPQKKPVLRENKP